MNDNVQIFENFLSSHECNLILNKCKTELTLDKAMVLGIDGSDTNNNIRKSSIAWVSELEFLNERLILKLKNSFNIAGMEVIGLGKFQFTEYKVGEYYNWHIDTINNKPGGRFASIVLLLNDEYSGGKLEIKNTNNEIIPLIHNIGTLFIFKSDLLHRVTPVETGVRYSLVNWVSLVKTNSKTQNLL
jgi:PKHD-type hydroxylase